MCNLLIHGFDKARQEIGASWILLNWSDFDENETCFTTCYADNFTQYEVINGNWVSINLGVQSQSY